MFDLRDRTFAPMETEPLVSLPGHGNRTVHIRSLRAVGFVAGSTVRVLSDVKRGLKLGVQPFLQQLQEQNDTLRQEAAAELAKQRAATYAGALPYRPAAEQTGPYSATGDLQETAKDAQVEGVGVYDRRWRGRPGRASGRGAVTVVVRRSPRPMVLVLSSYEAVDWRLHVESGAQLKAILLASYSDSTVSGAETVKTLNIGRTHAYDQGTAAFGNLQRDVMRWTGKPIGTFQGKYKATSFIVGGT